RQRQRLPERRRDPEGMNGRADIVSEPGKRQLGGARATADRRVRLEDDDAAPSLCEDDGRAQAVWARSDDDGISHASTNDRANSWPSTGTRAGSSNGRLRRFIWLR